MKNLSTIIAILSLTITTAFSNTVSNVIPSTTDIEVVSIGSLEFFTSASFDKETENVSFTTTTEISVVQIYNPEGKLEFQLPVMSDNVQIHKNLFGSGNYKLGFILEGQTQVHFTQITLK